jgi:putative transposase
VARRLRIASASRLRLTSGALGNGARRTDTQRFASTHDQVANLFMHSRYNRDAAAKRAARTQAFVAWGRASGARTFAVTAV